jgi:predicted nucleotidyltransferase
MFSPGEYNAAKENCRMKRSDVLVILKQHSEELIGLGVRSLELFGSVARNAAGPLSDVDLLVEIDRPMGLFGLLRIQHCIEQLLGGIEVDLVMKGSVLEELKDDILGDAVNVL